MPTVRYLFALAALAAPAILIAAETPPPVAKPVAALQACRAETNDAARLACYDKAVEAFAAATASQELVIVERSEVRRARKGLFGFNIPRIGFLAGRVGNVEDEAEAARVETKVVSARSIGNGKFRFTVEGGGIWETLETSMGFKDPVPGATIVLERGNLGAYFAKVGKGRRVQAKRIG